MFNSKNPTCLRSFRFRLLVFFLLSILACFIVVLCLDRIAAFSINNFTDHRLTYDRWGGNLFDRSEVEGLDLELNEGTFAVIAEKARFDLRTRQLFKKRQFVLECEMEGVSFPSADKSRSEPALVEEGAGEASSDSILAIPFSPDQKYDRMVFTVFLDKGAVRVEGFEAYSENVRMKGDYVFFKDKNEVSVDLKISFSPDISAALEGSIKENILSPDEGGWYSTVISYRGNPTFLRALFSLTTT